MCAGNRNDRGPWRRSPVFGWPAGSWRFGGGFSLLDRERLPKAIFPVLPKVRELVPYFGAGALFGD